MKKAEVKKEWDRLKEEHDKKLKRLQRHARASDRKKHVKEKLKEISAAEQTGGRAQDRTKKSCQKITFADPVDDKNGDHVTSIRTAEKVCPSGQNVDRKSSRSSGSVENLVEGPIRSVKAVGRSERHRGIFTESVPSKSLKVSSPRAKDQEKSWNSRVEPEITFVAKDVQSPVLNETVDGLKEGVRKVQASSRNHATKSPVLASLEKALQDETSCGARVEDLGKKKPTKSTELNSQNHRCKNEHGSQSGQHFFGSPRTTKQEDDSMVHGVANVTVQPSHRNQNVPHSIGPRKRKHEHESPSFSPVEKRTHLNSRNHGNAKCENESPDMFSRGSSGTDWPGVGTGSGRSRMGMVASPQLVINDMCGASKGSKCSGSKTQVQEVCPQEVVSIEAGITCRQFEMVNDMVDGSELPNKPAHQNNFTERLSKDSVRSETRTRPMIESVHIISNDLVGGQKQSDKKCISQDSVQSDSRTWPPTPNDLGSNPELPNKPKPQPVQLQQNSSVSTQESGSSVLSENSQCSIRRRGRRRKRPFQNKERTSNREKVGLAYDSNMSCQSQFETKAEMSNSVLVPPSQDTGNSKTCAGGASEKPTSQNGVRCLKETDRDQRESLAPSMENSQSCLFDSQDSFCEVKRKTSYSSQEVKKLSELFGGREMVPKTFQLPSPRVTRSRKRSRLNDSFMSQPSQDSQDVSRLEMPRCVLGLSQDQSEIAESQSFLMQSFNEAANSSPAAKMKDSYKSEVAAKLTESTKAEMYLFSNSSQEITDIEMPVCHIGLSYEHDVCPAEESQSNVVDTSHCAETIVETENSQFFPPVPSADPLTPKDFSLPEEEFGDLKFETPGPSDIGKSGQGAGLGSVEFDERVLGGDKPKVKYSSPKVLNENCSLKKAGLNLPKISCVTSSMQNLNNIIDSGTQESVKCPKSKSKGGASHTEFTVPNCNSENAIPCENGSAMPVTKSISVSNELKAECTSDSQKGIFENEFGRSSDLQILSSETKRKGLKSENVRERSEVDCSEEKRNHSAPFSQTVASEAEQKIAHVLDSTKKSDCQRNLSGSKSQQVSFGTEILERTCSASRTSSGGTERKGKCVAELQRVASERSGSLGNCCETANSRSDRDPTQSNQKPEYESEKYSTDQTVPKRKTEFLKHVACVVLPDARPTRVTAMASGVLHDGEKECPFVILCTQGEVQVVSCCDGKWAVICKWIGGQDSIGKSIHILPQPDVIAFIAVGESTKSCCARVFACDPHGEKLETLGSLSEMKIMENGSSPTILCHVLSETDIILSSSARDLTVLRKFTLDPDYTSIVSHLIFPKLQDHLNSLVPIQPHKEILLATSKHSVYIWNGTNGQLMSQVNVSQIGPILASATAFELEGFIFLPVLMKSNDNASLVIINPKTGLHKSVVRYETHGNRATCLHLSSTHLYSLHPAGDVTVWDVFSGQILGTLHQGHVDCMCTAMDSIITIVREKNLCIHMYDT